MSLVLLLAGSAAVSAQELTSEVTSPETTSQATTPESTTPAPGGDEPRFEAQQTSVLPGPGPGEGCAAPRQIATLSGTDNRRTDVFAVSSDVLRIRYLTEVTDPDTFDDNLVVTVLRANGDFVDSLLILEPASRSKNVLLPGPGNYYLEVEAGDVRYELAIDTCEGDLQPRRDGPGPNPSGPRDPRVIRVPEKPLPPTGGLAILAPAMGLLLISGTAAALLVGRRG